MNIKKAKVITVTSVKGGTGKTTFTLNVAGVLNNKKVKTLILDLDLLFGCIASNLNLTSNRDIFNLTDDMMNGRYKNIEDYIRKYTEYIDVISCPADPRDASKIHPKYIENIIRQINYKYDVILIDTNHALTNINASVFDLSDKILYLFTPDIMDLKNMKTIISIYTDMDFKNYRIILNNMKNKNYTNFEIETVLGKDIDYVLEKNYYEEEMQKYIYEGKIVSIQKKNNDLIKIVEGDVLDEEYVQKWI